MRALQLYGPFQPSSRHCCEILSHASITTVTVSIEPMPLYSSSFLRPLLRHARPAFLPLLHPRGISSTALLGAQRHLCATGMGVPGTALLTSDRTTSLIRALQAYSPSLYWLHTMALPPSPDSHVHYRCCTHGFGSRLLTGTLTLCTPLRHLAAVAIHCTHLSTSNAGG